MVILENLVNYVYTYISENGKVYLKNLGVEIKIPQLPFKRITYDEAIRIAKDSGEQIEWGMTFLPNPNIRSENHR